MSVCIVCKLISLPDCKRFRRKLSYSTLFKIYILLDVLLCSIAEYFYELCRILASP